MSHFAVSRIARIAVLSGMLLIASRTPAADDYQPGPDSMPQEGVPQGDGTSPVVLGQPGDTALLGVVTLEILGLVLNPFNRTLQPMKMLLV